MDADVDLITDGPRFHQGRRAGGTKPKIWQALWSSAGKMARQVADVYLCAGNVSPVPEWYTLKKRRGPYFVFTPPDGL